MHVFHQKKKRNLDFYTALNVFNRYITQYYAALYFPSPFKTKLLKFSLLFNHTGRTKPSQWEDIHNGQLLAKYQHDLILNKYTRAELCVAYSRVQQ